MRMVLIYMADSVKMVIVGSAISYLVTEEKGLN